MSKKILIVTLFLLQSFRIVAGFTDSLSIDVKEQDTCWIISLQNTSKDTVYIFDSYFRNNYSNTNSPLLYRYNKGKKECSVNFFPIVPYLTPNQSDVLVHGINSFGYIGQYSYNFTKLGPNDKIRIFIRKKHIEWAYKDVDYKKYSKYSFDFEFKKTKLPKRYKLVSKFAIYKDVSIFHSKDDFYYNEQLFNEQALSYDELIVTLKE
ncbi:MAG: hypothetical protein K6G31_07325 [Paludibacteraceae bacterium]|nr:hypothetical protein [Paludibacteraceae bacterium]